MKIWKNTRYTWDLFSQIPSFSSQISSILSKHSSNITRYNERKKFSHARVGHPPAMLFQPLVMTLKILKPVKTLKTKFPNKTLDDQVKYFET